MFTNWLTGTTGLTNSTSSSTNRLQESNQPPSSAAVHPAGLSPLVNTNSITNLNSNIMSSPPDIILEVGPAPTTIRFMAHGIVLGMHSGYLRSAIRLDERGSAESGGGTDIILYLTNVTPEQFAPLLTYMYTGYLDLNVENIFGVLLATHVLHMPRALEICRSYLARAQTEGYFGASNNNPTNSASHQLLSSSGKIIRPIASKPQLPNFSFLPIGHPIGLNTTLPNSSITATTSQETKRPNSVEECNKSEEDIEVDEVDKQSVCNDNHLKVLDDDEEDVEVFIDSTSEAEVVVEMEIQKLSFKKLVESKKSDKDKESKSKHEKSHHHKKSHKSERRRKSSSGLQVAKAPIPASQLDTSETNKVIIDVASCDGPVRFKRILNTAYGHKPESCSMAGNHVGMSTGGMLAQERSLQSVSLSFHQQMAKTISQQQHQLHQAEESENSETSNGSNGAGAGGGASGNASVKASGSRKIQSEIFVCVYCKHTFKSQYCYQKHAKRHLNPLTLQATCVPEDKREHNEEFSSTSQQAELQITKHQNISTTRPFYVRNSTHFATSTSSSSSHQQPAAPTSLQSSPSPSSSSDYLRREVRPLDMNVQYYPCKTCGSKFPSYYFVHKHRKMCHADEESTTAQQSSDNRGDNTTTSSATVTGGVSQEEGCMNSKSSD